MRESLVKSLVLINKLKNIGSKNLKNRDNPQETEEFIYLTFVRQS